MCFKTARQGFFIFLPQRSVWSDPHANYSNLIIIQCSILSLCSTNTYVQLCIYLKRSIFLKNTDKYTIAKERWKIPVTWVFWSPHRNRATEAWRPHLVSSNQLDFRLHFSLSLHRCRVHRFQENMIEMSVPVPQDDSHLHLKFSLMWWKTNCNY